MSVKQQAVRWWVPAASVAALGLIAGMQSGGVDPAVAAPFHAKVREVAKGIPINFGDWVGKDVPVPIAAQTLLRPNIIISRAYQNEKSGQQLDFLLVQCQQSRDMDGHYPPNCYPGAGWVLESPGTPAMWTVDGVQIPGCEYQFKIDRAGGTQRITVRNFFILPDGRFFPDLSSFRRPAAAFKLRPFGAAQVQVIFRGETDPADRDVYFGQFIHTYLPLIQAARNGVPQ